MILTQNFLELAGACSPGASLAVADNYLGMEYGEVIRALIRDGKTEEAGWMVEQKKTELYVRMNGAIIMNETYQVFNPLTGVHTQYTTLAEAKTAIAEVSLAVLANHGVQVMKELRNDNGDTTWIACDPALSLSVVVN